MKNQLLALALTCILPVSGCGTLSDAATIVASIDWVQLLETIEGKYIEVAGPLLAVCASEPEGSIFDAACAELHKLDNAAASAVAIAHIAVAEGQNVEAAVNAAEVEVNKITAAFKGFREAKARNVTFESARSRSVVTGAEPFPVANPYRERASKERAAAADKAVGAK